MSELRTGRALPWYFWVVATLGILWNGFGAFLWWGSSFMADTFLAGLTPDHRAYVIGLPGWSVFTWGLGVVGGLVGSILLLFRHRLAVTALGLSLIGAVTNSLVYYTNPPPPGFFNLPLTAFIISFALFLLWFATAMKRRGLL